MLEKGGRWEQSIQGLGIEARDTGNRAAAELTTRNREIGSGAGSRPNEAADKRGRDSGGGRARRQEAEAGDGGGCEKRSKTYCSDTMLGIDKLYSQGVKGHNI
jgi:hypothetical protein